MNDSDQARILAVDDDHNFLKVLAYNLSRAGARVETAENGRQALERLRQEAFDLVLSDVKMPELDGLGLLRELRLSHPDLPVILVTAHGDIEMAVQAMQWGATDFITKPFQREQLQEKVERALRLPRLERENRALREELTNRFAFRNIIGSSPAMRQMFELMGRVVERDTTVLILGESGTGKELVARALHYGGPRKNGRFVALNCAAIPANLLESELFGHVKGAFTGADAAREGRFQQASGGTLFLDEIGDMPLELQSKLLRVLQERTVEPVGSSRATPVNVRIIAATNQELDRLVESGQFRQDLYYRLAVVLLPVPPLRDRKPDILLLVPHFLKQFGEAGVRVEPAAMERLEEYDWPGNVRELENTIERALALRAHADRLVQEDVRRYCRNAPRADRARMEVPDSGLSLDAVEKQLIESALQKTGNNQSRAAKLLGITRQKLIYRMQKHGIG